MPEGHLYRLAWSFYLVLGIAGVVWVGVREEEIPLSIFVSTSTWLRDVGLGIGAAGLLLGIWEIADRFLPLAKVLEDRLRGVIGHLDPGEAVGLAVLSGFAEEFFFRGAVQGSWGWLVASVLFAALHSGRERALYLWTAFAFVSGLLFAGLTIWTGNLLAPSIGHVGFNAVNLYRLAVKDEA